MGQFLFAKKPRKFNGHVVLLEEGWDKSIPSRFSKFSLLYLFKMSFIYFSYSLLQNTSHPTLRFKRLIDNEGRELKIKMNGTKWRIEKYWFWFWALF